MSQNLELPDPLYDALQQAASSSGTTAAGWIAAHLPAKGEQPSANGAKSLGELFAGRTGRFSSGSKEALSENCGRRFTDDLEQKRREGRL